MKRNKLLLFSLILPCLATPVQAADVNAASASRADVATAINSASTGDRVLVPSGTETWSTLIALPATKDLDIIGSGIGNTVLTCDDSGICFEIHLAAAHRISGFTLLTSSAGGIRVVRNGDQNPNKWFRIDHNRIVSDAGWTSIEISGGTNGVHPQGLVDNNELFDVAIHANGTTFQLDEADFQHVLWSHQTPLGDNSQIVYIEDNTFEGTSSNINWADSNYGGRYVFRFNTLVGKGYQEAHSMVGSNRASQRWEIYKNTRTSGSNAFPGMAFLRGGSGVLWGNRLPSNFTWGLVMDNVRSEVTVSTCGKCDGLSACDENTPGESGHLCRDQIGIANDTVRWDDNPIGAWNQVFQPVYFWDNIIEPSTQIPIDNQGLDTWLLENRDWYKTDTAFDGTKGVGEGTIANRPATCTTGVAYWATDEGEWNSRQAGPDGRLYKCTATNTWTLYYTPFTYPHPLQSGAVVPPLPPTNLGVVVR